MKVRGVLAVAFVFVIAIPQSIGLSLLLNGPAGLLFKSLHPSSPVLTNDVSFLLLFKFTLRIGKQSLRNDLIQMNE